VAQSGTRGFYALPVALMAGDSGQDGIKRRATGPNASRAVAGHSGRPAAPLSVLPCPPPPLPPGPARTLRAPAVPLSVLGRRAAKPGGSQPRRTGRFDGRRVRRTRRLRVGTRGVRGQDRFCQIWQNRLFRQIRGRRWREPGRTEGLQVPRQPQTGAGERGCRGVRRECVYVPHGNSLIKANQGLERG
jgi:hypothetical protein